MDKKESYKLTNKLVLISCLVTFYLFYTEGIQADENKQPNERISQSYDPLDPDRIIQPIIIEDDDELNLTISFEDAIEEDEPENIPDGTKAQLVLPNTKKEKKNEGDPTLNYPDAPVVGNPVDNSGGNSKENSYLAELCLQLSGTFLYGTKYSEC